MHELFNIVNNKETNITPLVGSISWRSNIKELGDQLDFDIAFNDTRFFPINPVDVGNLIILKNAEEIFRGIVVSETRKGRDPIQYTAFDYAFYLNKSKAVYQFNKAKASEAITKILNDFSIPVGNVASISTIVDKIYIDKVLSDIIKDILDIAQKETGTKYQTEMRQGKLYIEKQEDMLISATFQLASNIAPNNVTSAISNPRRKRSIEEMRNSIQIVSDNKVIAEVKNDELIKKYGILQELSNINKEDVAQAKNIAQNMLNDLGKVFEENDIEVPGNDEVRSGRLIEIEEPVTEMSGKYFINDVTHTVANGIHKMKLGLGVV